MPANVHVQDTTELLLRVLNEDDSPVNLSGGATTLRINLRKPDGITVLQQAATGGSLLEPEKTAALGYMRYVTTVDDLDVEGTWAMQGVVLIDAGRWATEITRFTVLANLA